jgi:hypothetical protein
MAWNNSELLNVIIQKEKHKFNIYTVTICVCDYRRGMDWILDLLNTYTHHSELQVITAPSLISTLYKSPHHPLNLFQPAVS